MRVKSPCFFVLEEGGGPIRDVVDRAVGVFEHVVLAVAAVAFGVRLFVLFYEEPTLRRKFRANYEEYCRNVRRWWPRVRAWEKPWAVG